MKQQLTVAPQLRPDHGVEVATKQHATLVMGVTNDVVARTTAGSRQEDGVNRTGPTQTVSGAILHDDPAQVGVVPFVAVDRQAAAYTDLRAQSAAAMVAPGSGIQKDLTVGARIQVDAPTDIRSQSSRWWRML